MAEHNVTGLNWESRPVTSGLYGAPLIPGDKSISHRALMLAALAEGRSYIQGFLEGEDTLATARALSQLGVAIEASGSAGRLVKGVGLHGLRQSQQVLDCGNAGTAIRLLTGLLAGQDFSSTLAGDASLSKRPMRRVTDPLSRMGARIDTQNGCPPLAIHGGQPLKGICYSLPVASAQVKSALLLAGLYAEGETEIIEPRPTRDYTERMLASFGWPMQFEAGRASLTGGHRLLAYDVDVPADFSSAAFFLVAASLVPGSELMLPKIGLNPRRTGLLKALRVMGADIRSENLRINGGEQVADLVVRHASLHGIELALELVPDMIDEFPILFVAAALAEGRTVVRGVGELRVKESDRLAGMAAGLRALGVTIEESPDGAIIEGGRLRGGRVDSLGDHRLAMSFAVAGLMAENPVEIADCANVATSFPGFVELATACGFALTAQAE